MESLEDKNRQTSLLCDKHKENKEKTWKWNI